MAAAHILFLNEAERKLLATVVWIHLKMVGFKVKAGMILGRSPSSQHVTEVSMCQSLLEKLNSKGEPYEPQEPPAPPGSPIAPGGTSPEPA